MKWETTKHAPEMLSSATAPMKAATESFADLSVRTLKRIIADAGLESFDCLEKSALVERAHHATHAEIKREEAVAGGGPPRHVAQRTRVVRIPNLFSAADINDIKALSANCAFSSSQPGRDAWRTKYLNAEHRFGTALPHLRARLVETCRRVDAEEGWRLLSSSDAQHAPRVVEHHLVCAPGSLPWTQHIDRGSLVTIDVMMTQPEHDFGGGAFQTLEAHGELRRHAFEQGDALVFVSHKPHCVAPTAWGVREVLVMELWRGVERCCAHRCDRPFGPCPGTCAPAS